MVFRNILSYLRIKLIKFLEEESEPTKKFLKEAHTQIENLSVELPFKIEDYFSLNISNGNCKLHIKESSHFRKFCNILLDEGAELIIGKNVFFNNYCSINCLESITIGDNTIMGEGVKIYDHNHKYQFNNDVLNIQRFEFNKKAIKIGKNCWISSNVTILKGVEIGDNVIIGANCLIYKSIPSNTIIKFSSEGVK